MTTNTAPDLNLLAEDPRAFDTTAARLTADRDKAVEEITRATNRLHELAGDRKRYRGGRNQEWGLTDLQAEKLAQRAAVHGDQQARVVLTSRAAAQVMAEAITDELLRMDNAYTGWTRFFPSITKSQPHIHRSLNCRTLHPTTQMRWAPELSGRTDEQAVAELDEALCSVCFPSAPVALHNYVSKRSQAEQDARAAEKAARDAVKAAKTLTEDQTKAIGRDHHNDRVTTVAACKELIRASVECDVEFEWILQDERINDQGMTPEILERMRMNRRDRLVSTQEAARKAMAVLIDREQAHPGWGMTAEAIEVMLDRAEKRARKAWFK